MSTAEFTSTQVRPRLWPAVVIVALMWAVMKIPPLITDEFIAMIVAFMWGPMAGWHASRAGADMAVVPLTRDTGGPRLTYRITMGVRAADQEWKRQLNRIIRDNQAEITKILQSYGVPLLDDNDRPFNPPAMK